MSSKTKQFRIALPGMTAYAETNSRRHAIRLLHKARQVLGSQVVVYDTRAGKQITEYDLNTAA